VTVAGKVSDIVGLWTQSGHCVTLETAAKMSVSFPALGAT
jgi:hypothetical protein